MHASQHTLWPPVLSDPSTSIYLDFHFLPQEEKNLLTLTNREMDSIHGI
jgi:hypothetical protein